MIPSTLLGLLLFISVLGPGYIWLRYTETRVTRAERSGVLEAADVIFVGGLATGLSAIVVFAIGSSGFDLPKLHEIVKPDALSSEQLADLVVAGVVTVILAAVGTLLVAFALFGRNKKLIRPGVSIWQTALGIPSKDATVVVSVEMRDGRIVEGLFLAHTTGKEEDERQLVLGAPLRMIWPATSVEAARRGKLPADRIVISASEIVTISAKDFVPNGDHG